MSINANPRRLKHIAIAGNIGAGKTTLTTLLANHFGWTPHYEDTETNPYLSDFYHDMQRWSFNLQIYFLNSRYRQILEILNGDETVVQDRTIYEDAYIFAPNLNDMGLMTSRDFENYYNLFKTMNSQISSPDLLIYLRANIPTLVEHIQARGRAYEGNMSLDYLKCLNERYEMWISNYKQDNLLIINADAVDFMNNPNDLKKVIDRIQEKIDNFLNKKV